MLKGKAAIITGASYAAVQEPKELYEVADAEHIDLYDRTDCIPFNKLAEFFKKSM